MYRQAIKNLRTHFGKTCLTLALLAIAGCQSSPQTSSGPPTGEVFRDNARTHGGGLRPSSRVRPSVANIDSQQPYTLWVRIRNGFMLDPAAIDSPRIDQQRLLFASQPRYFELSSERTQRYLHYVVEQLDDRDMPMELALLPFIESSYNPMAYSRSHAAGLWQFIPSTGQMYSLRQDTWYDGRRDITASTQAAMDYLTRLNQIFEGDWLLTLAAYNCGDGCVGRAMKRNESLGLPTDYWNLQLPEETMNYVPKLLALAQIIYSPTVYGTILPDLNDEPYFGQVTIKRPLDLHKAAELAEVSTEELLSLNPAFNQRVTAPQGPYQLLIPINRVEQFSAALAVLPDSERVGFQNYQVRAGDNLSQIASRHQTSVNAIRELNGLSSNMLSVGQSLMIPVGGSDSLPAQIASQPATSTSSSFSYQVQPGDNLWAIARRHGLSVSSLKQHNGLSNQNLTVGQTLTMPAGANRTASSSQPTSNTQRKTTYTVRSGDSLYSIARRFNVEVQNIRTWNRVGTHITPGQQLTLHLR